MYLGMASLISLAACSSHDAPRPAATPEIPSVLEFKAPTGGPGLTSDQATSLKKSFKVTSTMTLPPGDLVFPDKNADRTKIAEQEQELAAKDPNAFKLLQDVRKNCQKGHPTYTWNSTAPNDDITEDNLITNDTAQGSAAAALIGTNCPVDLTASASAGALVKQKDSTITKVSASEGIKFNAVMKNPEYAKLLGAKGMIIETSVSGLGIRRAVELGKEDRIYATAQLTGSYLSLTETIPYQIKAKILQTKLVDGTQKSEVTYSMTVKTAAVSAVIDAHMISENNQMTLEAYYINGKKVTAQELAAMFADQVPGAAQTASLVQSLK